MCSVPHAWELNGIKDVNLLQWENTVCHNRGEATLSVKLLGFGKILTDHGVAKEEQTQQ